MAFEFESFVIDSIGRVLTVEKHRFAWVRLSISLTDPETSAHPSLEIQVPIQYENDWTIEQIHEIAFEKASATLKESLELFEQHNLQGLQRLDEEHEAAQAAEDDLLRS